MPGTMPELFNLDVRVLSAEGGVPPPRVITNASHIYKSVNLILGIAIKLGLSDAPSETNLLETNNRNIISEPVVTPPLLNLNCFNFLVGIKTLPVNTFCVVPVSPATHDILSHNTLVLLLSCLYGENNKLVVFGNVFSNTSATTGGPSVSGHLH